MGIIEKIRNKPHTEKVAIIWIAVIVVAVIMILLWILSAHFAKNAPKDTTLFQTIGKGLHDIQNNYKK